MSSRADSACCAKIGIAGPIALSAAIFTLMGDTAQDSSTIDVIIPARNEERSISRVIGEIPRNLVRKIIVADNASTDSTASVAHQAGACIVPAPVPGYGEACLRALQYLRDTGPPDIVVFLDGDYSDFPGEMGSLVTPILEGHADLVIGSRVLGNADAGALTPHQQFGNWLATRLIRKLYGQRFTDLGPFRAIRWTCLEAMHMQDRDYGWTVEMQVKAAKLGLRCTEVPVSYRKRIGISKVSGTVRGSVLAGHKILMTIFKLYRQ